MRFAPLPPATWRDPEEHRRQIRDFVASLASPGLTGWMAVAGPAVELQGGGSPPGLDLTIPGLLFDSTLLEDVVAAFRLPEGFDPAISSDAYLDVVWTRTTSASGGVWWEADVRLSPVGTVVPGATTLGSSTVLGYAGDDNTADRVLVTRIGPFAVEALPGDLVLVVFQRDPANGSDTYGADARLLSLDLRVTRAGATEDLRA